MIRNEKFYSLEKANDFIYQNNIKEKDILSLTEHVSQETVTEKVDDWTGGRDVYFKEGQTTTRLVTHSIWSLTYKDSNDIGSFIRNTCDLEIDSDIKSYRTKEGFYAYGFGSYED